MLEPGTAIPLGGDTKPRLSLAAWTRHSQQAHVMAQGINVLALVKDGERYVFLYDDHSTSQVLQTLGRYAADPELSFSWYDAAVLSQRVRQLQQRTSDATPSLYRETA